MKWQHSVMWLVALVVLGLVNLSIFQKEQLVAQGQIIFLELAPRDPRALLQGDYMVLRYDIAQTLGDQALPKDGQLVLKLDENNMAHYERLYEAQYPLANDEVILSYYQIEGDIKLGAESFFFQEGHADYYNEARYAELLVTAAGESILVGLRGENLERLGPPDEEK